jgi:lipopolysaccharide transport system permease protein
MTQRAVPLTAANLDRRGALAQLVATHWRLRRVLYASARVELKKRYAGSILGSAWTVLYPLLFLSVYLFLWLVVFRVRFPGAGSTLDYVVFVFAGLVPYLFAVDSLTSAVNAIRQNIHLVKGVVMPVELLPTRSVAVALAAHVVGVAILLVLCAISADLSWRAILLPLVLALQVLGLSGLAWIVAGLGVLVPDTAYVINLATTLMMFVAPIAFTPDMVPSQLRAVVWLNPVTYMVGAYRAALLGSRPFSSEDLLVFAVLAIAAFVLGAVFCSRFKNSVVDYE